MKTTRLWMTKINSTELIPCDIALEPATPIVGPWHVGTKEAHHCVYDAHGWQIADASPLGKSKETLQNARLIAAAPELLEAATDLLDAWDKTNESLRAKLRAAIAKAKA